MRRKSQRAGSSSKRKNREHRVGLTLYQEKALKDRLRKSSPSEPWVEEQVKTVIDRVATGRPIIYRYHDTHAFPPGGENTKMIRCPECGIFMPPNAFEHGKCLDHARHDGWGPSPSAVAIRALQMLHLELVDSELEPEDVRSLRREIRAFQRKTAKNVTFDTNL